MLKVKTSPMSFFSYSWFEDVPKKPVGPVNTVGWFVEVVRVKPDRVSNTFCQQPKNRLVIAVLSHDLLGLLLFKQKSIEMIFDYFQSWHYSYNFLELFGSLLRFIKPNGAFAF